VFIDEVVTPGLDAIMIRAFGDSYKYERVGADFVLIRDEEDPNSDIITGFGFKAVFKTDLIKDFDGSPDLIAQDEAFFFESLRSIPGIIVDKNSAKMDTKEGRVIFSLKIMLGSI
jgi:hypothetical protein